MFANLRFKQTHTLISIRILKINSSTQTHTNTSEIYCHIITTMMMVVVVFHYGNFLARNYLGLIHRHKQTNITSIMLIIHQPMNQTRK